MRTIKFLCAITIIYVMFNWVSGMVMWASEDRLAFDNKVSIALAEDR